MSNAWDHVPKLGASPHRPRALTQNITNVYIHPVLTDKFHDLSIHPVMPDELMIFPFLMDYIYNIHGPFYFIMKHGLL